MPVMKWWLGAYLSPVRKAGLPWLAQEEDATTGVNKTSPGRNKFELRKAIASEIFVKHNLQPERWRKPRLEKVCKIRGDQELNH